MEGRRGRGRPQRTWRDEVIGLLMRNELSKREGMVLARDGKACGILVYRSE